MEPCTSYTRSGAKPALWNWPSTFEVTTNEGRPKRSVQVCSNAKPACGVVSRYRRARWP